jgi:hypothetical protein
MIKSNCQQYHFLIDYWLARDLKNLLVFNPATSRLLLGKKHTRAEGTAGRACLLNMWAFGAMGVCEVHIRKICTERKICIQRFS